MPLQRDPKLYNKDIAAAFRAAGKKRTRWLSPERRLVRRVAGILGGKRPPLTSGIEARACGLDLPISSTEQYWPLIRDICQDVPTLGCTVTEFVYLTIYQTPIS